MGAAQPKLAFDHVTRRYDGVSAVDALSLQIDEGSFVALVGTSGSGKSTLLRLVNRLDRPDQGKVLIDGRDVATLDPIELRRSVGYVFQNIGLFPHMTIAENIGIVPRLAGRPPTDIAAALDRVGLPANYAGRLPAQLSGGEQQRVGIARALAGEGKLLLMDEPFGALDPVTRDTLGRTVQALHDVLGLTTILVTHDMAEALLLADRVVVMARGCIVGDATPREMLGGLAGPGADALVAIPREQAERLRRLAE
ncbi:ATP-binding cassette domain-containing protein [Sphingomonas crusticola]|uniref:ATP-binding cassette domain-containing protein n=1 Tax=Sphingomonas crusticola TaxID=1697973 RepID=UPI000E227262|nr:ATP-binding cassette domain-containing protein [Sphingomonas crusticola]